MKKLKKIKKRKPSRKKLSRTQSRYKFKSGFADKARDTSKTKYRKSRGSEFELTGSVVLRSLEFLDDKAEPLMVVNNLTSENEVLPVIRQTVLADLLDTSYQTVWRWISERNQLPEPALIDNSEGRGRGVYHVEEARVIIAAIGEHLRDYRYYRKDHTGVHDRVFDQIDDLRNNHFGENTHGTKIQGKETRVKIKKRKSRG